MTAPTRAEAVEAIALLDEPVRRDLYEWVVAQPDAVGRDQAAAALGITRSLAAFHLDRLAGGGLLATEFRRLSGRTGPGAGRPAKLYRRAEREIDVSLPERRYAVAADLFARALERAGVDTETMRAVAREAGADLGREARTEGEPGAAPGAAPGDSASLPTSKALEIMANRGYEPVVDEDGTIRLRNCPFHALTAEHRGLTCGMNHALAEGMLEGMGATGLHAELDPQPGWCCVALRGSGS